MSNLKLQFVFYFQNPLLKFKLKYAKQTLYLSLILKIFSKIMLDNTFWRLCGPVYIYFHQILLVYRRMFGSPSLPSPFNWGRKSISSNDGNFLFINAFQVIWSKYDYLTLFWENAAQNHLK